MSDDSDKGYRITWDSRLSAIETNHLQLQKDVSALASDVSALTAAVSSISESVKTIALNQSTHLKTNWGVIFSGLGVLVLVLGLVVYEPLMSLEQSIENHMVDGHPTAVKTELARVEQIVKANEAALESRLDRKQEQLLIIEQRLDQLDKEHQGMSTTIFNIEREIFPNTKYRAGRPN